MYYVRKLKVGKEAEEFINTLLDEGGEVDGVYVDTECNHILILGADRDEVERRVQKTSEGMQDFMNPENFAQKSIKE